jgi:hypothetical protein
VKAIYSNHLINRLHLRNIPEQLPAEIVDTSQERYYDTETGYHIAVKKAFLHGGMRELMVAYAIEGEVRRLITISFSDTLLAA